MSTPTADDFVRTVFYNETVYFPVNIHGVPLVVKDDGGLMYGLVYSDEEKAKDSARKRGFDHPTMERITLAEFIFKYLKFCTDREAYIGVDWPAHDVGDAFDACYLHGAIKAFLPRDKYKKWCEEWSEWSKWPKTCP
jgi:hypothetical protein